MRLQLPDMARRIATVVMLAPVLAALSCTAPRCPGGCTRDQALCSYGVAGRRTPISAIEARPGKRTRISDGGVSLGPTPRCEALEPGCGPIATGSLCGVGSGPDPTAPRVPFGVGHGLVGCTHDGECTLGGECGNECSSYMRDAAFDDTSLHGCAESRPPDSALCGCVRYDSRARRDQYSAALMDSLANEDHGVCSWFKQ
jgi:hypothetical protein